jgi:hypothetical protein
LCSHDHSLNVPSGKITGSRAYARGGLVNNHKQEKWKAPLPEFIEELYYKRFRKEKPDVIAKLT